MLADWGRTIEECFLCVNIQARNQYGNLIDNDDDDDGGLINNEGGFDDDDDEDEDGRGEFRVTRITNYICEISFRIPL
jgi:hypothetical protein